MSDQEETPAPRRNPSRVAVQAVSARMQLDTLGRRLDCQSHEEWVPFLKALQTAFDDAHPGLVAVFPGPISYKTADHRKQIHKTWPEDTLSGSRTLREWVDSDARRGRGISLAVMVTMNVNLIGHTQGHKGKALACYDTNERNDGKEGQKRIAALGAKWGWTEVVRKVPGRKNEHVWLNESDDLYNTKSDGVPLTVEWLKRMVDHGFDIHHTADGVLDVLTGFHKLPL